MKNVLFERIMKESATTKYEEDPERTRRTVEAEKLIKMAIGPLQEAYQLFSYRGRESERDHLLEIINSLKSFLFVS